MKRGSYITAFIHHLHQETGAGDLGQTPINIKVSQMTNAHINKQTTFWEIQNRQEDKMYSADIFIALHFYGLPTLPL